MEKADEMEGSSVINEEQNIVHNGEIFIQDQLTMVDFNKEKLFIHLALAKPALPQQFDLLRLSQSKANASKYFCLFGCTARNKSSDF
jgi:hypothetical protein